MLYSAWYIAPRVMLWIPSAVSSAAQSPVGRGGEYALMVFAKPPPPSAA